MAFRDGPLQDLKVPIAWIGGLSAVIMGCVALGLLLTDNRDKADGGAYGSARGEFSEVMQPVSGVLAAPMRGLGSVGDYIGGYFFAVSENRRLKARIKELERVRDEAVALKNVNARYEQLLQLRTEPPVPMITARAVTDARGPFSNARLLDAGASSGVKIGYPVMSDHGVVGRVVGVARGASRVLLLTDADSRMPVLVDRTGARAILTGDGGGAPRLEYLRGVEPVKQGDMVLSSGDGGLFPRGLPVGVAVKDLRGAWRVRLYAEAQDVDYVRILQFEDFAKVASEAELRAKTLPPLPAADAQQLALATAARAAPPPAPKPPAGAAPQAAGAAGVTTPATASTATASPTAGVRAKPANSAAFATPRPSSATALTPAPTQPRPSKAPPAAGAASAGAVKPRATTTTAARPAATTTTATTKPRVTTATTTIKPKRPKAPAARSTMAPIPDDYTPPRRSAGAIAPDLEAAMRRERQQ